MGQRGNRQHSAKFRIEIAQRMLAGENVSALSARYKIARSMMYRWRDAYRENGPAAFHRSPGRPKGQGLAPVSNDGSQQRLHRQIAELERKVGQQAVEIDFFRGVFRRLEQLPKTSRTGGTPSTRRSGE